MMPTVRIDSAVMTSGVADWAGEDLHRAEFCWHVLGLVSFGEWGELDEHDRRANDHAARTGEGRILGSYGTPDGRTLWAIVDGLGTGSTVLTFLWPSEY
jgi:hypothetical protein